MNTKWVKLLSLIGVVSLFSSACVIGGAQPAATESGQAALQTAVYQTLTALPPAAQTPLPTQLPATPTIPDTPAPQAVTPTFTPSVPVDTLSFTPTPSWTPTPVNLLPVNVVIEGLGCIPTHTHQDLAIVLKVIDGSTIQVILNGQTVIVSYIGVSAPAMPSGSNPGGRLANEAYLKNKSLVDGKIVILVKDTTEADASGHLLRYVLTDKLFINNEMVKSGYAAALAVPPDVACRATFEATQKTAMAQLLGVWQPTATSTPRPNGLPSLTPTFKKSDH